MSSKQPRKQRKFVFNAPLHIAREFMSAALSKDLRKKYSKRSLIVRKGDRVKIVRGQFKSKTGNVTDVQISTGRIVIDGITITKKDGKKTAYLIHPSKIVMLELNLEDKKRKRSLERKGAIATPKKAEVKAEKSEKKNESKTNEAHGIKKEKIESANTKSKIKELN